MAKVTYSSLKIKPFEKTVEVSIGEKTIEIK